VGHLESHSTEPDDQCGVITMHLLIPSCLPDLADITDTITLSSGGNAPTARLARTPAAALSPVQKQLLSRIDDVKAFFR
jgi:hypothetical protein